jgi:hypothetical protein
VNFAGEVGIARRRAAKIVGSDTNPEHAKGRPVGGAARDLKDGDVPKMFIGARLLTTDNPDRDGDAAFLAERKMGPLRATAGETV